MAIINMYEAKTHLSRLVDRAEAGEEIIIARNGKPAAKLIPVARDKAPRVGGSMRGLIHVSDNFDDPDPEFEALFYGETEEEIAKDKLWYGDLAKEPKDEE
ncbi:MAG TPA: type II toxin-antitoxin system Phd/YefM family antitoxin [Chloroflexota bacterium]|jgi:prevent-host-death family protein